MEPPIEPDRPTMIEAVRLAKHYGRFAALRDVSFSIPAAQVAAFLGCNGAGKSTTMRVLTGYVTPTQGVARVAGLDVATHRSEVATRIGYLPENGPLYPEMTPVEILRFLGRARGMPRARLAERLDAVLHQCALHSVQEKPIRKLSKGYRQRVGLAQALLHDPEVLILDEPTSGLDPNQIRDVRALIRTLAGTKTILLSTHILQEVAAVADHVILIHEGVIAFDGTIDKLPQDGETLEEAFYRITASPEAQPAPQAATNATTPDGSEEDDAS
jgi:ABC-2 type transport system ATP-binding protein